MTKNNLRWLRPWKSQSLLTMIGQSEAIGTRMHFLRSPGPTLETPVGKQETTTNSRTHANPLVNVARRVCVCISSLQQCVKLDWSRLHLISTEPAKGHARKKIVSRAHEIVSRDHEILSRAHEIPVILLYARNKSCVACARDSISWPRDISRAHEIVSRGHEIRFFFLHVPSRAP